jgi:hypothetical protein
VGRGQLLRASGLTHAGQPDGEEQGRAWVHIGNYAESRRGSASELHGVFVRTSARKVTARTAA